MMKKVTDINPNLIISLIENKLLKKNYGSFGINWRVERIISLKKSNWKKVASKYKLNIEIILNQLSFVINFFK